MGWISMLDFSSAPKLWASGTNQHCHFSFPSQECLCPQLSGIAK